MKKTLPNTEFYEPVEESLSRGDCTWDLKLDWPETLDYVHSGVVILQ